MELSFKIVLISRPCSENKPDDQHQKIAKHDQ